MTDIVSPTPIPEYTTPLPDASDESTFDIRAFSLFNHLVGVLSPGANTIGNQAYQNALAASESAEMAKSSAAFVGDWVDLSGALSMPASVFHIGRFWALRTNLANVALSTPSDVSADWVAIGPIDAAGLSFDNTASGLTASNAQAAIDEVRAKSINTRNLFHNAELENVFRNGGATPPTTLTTGQFLIDRWKAGATGLTRLPPSAISGAIGWSAGTLVQELIDFGTLTIGQQITVAWSGTAVVRFNGGAWLTSPATFTAAGPTTTVTVEFGISSGSATLSIPRAYIGAVDKGWYPLPMYELEPILERYYRRVSVLHQFVAAAGANQIIVTASHGRMVSSVTPTVVGAQVLTNASSCLYSAGSTDRFYITLTSTAAGNCRVTATVQLDSGF